MMYNYLINLKYIQNPLNYNIQAGYRTYNNMYDSSYRPIWILNVRADLSLPNKSVWKASINPVCSPFNSTTNAYQQALINEKPEVFVTNM